LKIWTQGTTLHCSFYILPHFQRGSFPSPITSAKFMCLFLPHNPIKNFIFIKKQLYNHCVFLYILVRFYEKLYFKKRIFVMEEKEIMTVKQVVEYLQIDEHTVYKFVHSGQIPPIKIAG